MTRLQRVFIDTSELFPFTIMDVLLTLSEDLFFTWVWTDEVLDEWAEVIVREGRRSPESAASVVEAVRTHFARDRIDPSTYVGKVSEDLSPDPADRVHAAAAIHGSVDVLLTRNVKHLRTAAVLAAQVRVITADEFLCELTTLYRQGVVESLIRAADSRKNPPTTPRRLATMVAKAGAPRFVELIRGDVPER